MNQLLNVFIIFYEQFFLLHFKYETCVIQKNLSVKLHLIQNAIKKTLIDCQFGDQRMIR